MSHPIFIPSHKFDLDACLILKKTSDAEIRPYLKDLLDWLADANWPVARPITERLETMGTELAPSINNVLNGSDAGFKYFLLSGLMLTCKAEVRDLCMEHILRIINHPTPSEKKEEVDFVARDVMILHGFSSGE